MCQKLLCRTIRRAFDRALGDQNESKCAERITLDQCRCALNFLGCSQNLLQTENLSDIVKSHRDMSKTNNRSAASSEITIDFEEFCVLTSYLTILQEEISESGCVSPIKGTNLPPPPIFLTNTPGEYCAAGIPAIYRLSVSNLSLKFLCRMDAPSFDCADGAGGADHSITERYASRQWNFIANSSGAPWQQTLKQDNKDSYPHRGALDQFLNINCRSANESE